MIAIKNHSPLNSMFKLAGIIGLLGFCMLATDLHRFFLFKSDLPCAEIESQFGLRIAGQSQCDKRGLLIRDAYIELDQSQSEDALANVIEFRPDTTEKGQRVRFWAYNSGLSLFRIFSLGDDKQLGISSGDVSNWSGNALTEFVIEVPPHHQGFRVEQFKAAGGKLLFGGFNIEAMTDTPTDIALSQFKASKTGSSWLLLFGYLTLVAGVFYAWSKAREQASPFIICCLFLIMTIEAGTPFGTQLGWVDPGDDTSYLSWALAMGFEHSPDLKGFPIESYAKDRNWHPWGTGLMLAPALALQKLVLPSTAVRGNLTFSVIAYTTIAMVLASIFIYYRTFIIWFKPQIAIVISLGTVAFTSLLKWTFLRQIFTHAPEALVLSIFSYCFVHRYLRRDGNYKREDMKIIIYMGVCACLFMLVQIRRENIFLVGLPIYFEWLRFGKAAWKGMMGIGLAGVCALLVLYASNLFTHAPGFFYTPNGSLFRFDLWDQLTKNAYAVLFGHEFGFLAIWNVVSYLAILGWMRQIKKVKVWLPFVGITLVYLLMCMLFEFPNGMEWQNRFLLKLNPILFAGMGVALSQKKWRGMRLWPMWVFLLGAALYYQIYYQYPANLPPTLPTYADMFSDIQILQAQDISRMRTLFFMPVILLSITSTWLYLRIVWSRQDESQTRNS